MDSRMQEYAERLFISTTSYSVSIDHPFDLPSDHPMPARTVEFSQLNPIYRGVSKASDNDRRPQFVEPNLSRDQPPPRSHH